MSSDKKLLIVLLIAIFTTIALMFAGYGLAGPIIGFTIFAFGLKEHNSRCMTCNSWRTRIEEFVSVDGGIGKLRRCSKCGRGYVI
jgi:hypothetical protein